MDVVITIKSRGQHFSSHKKISINIDIPKPGTLARLCCIQVVLGGRLLQINPFDFAFVIGVAGDLILVFLGHGQDFYHVVTGGVTGVF